MQEVYLTLCSHEPCFWFIPEDVKFRPPIEEHNVLSLLPLFQWPELEPGPRGFCSQVQPWRGSVLLPGTSQVMLFSLHWHQWPQRSFTALFLPLGSSGARSSLKHLRLPPHSPSQGIRVLTTPQLGALGATMTLTPVLLLQLQHILLLEATCHTLSNGRDQGRTLSPWPPESPQLFGVLWPSSTAPFLPRDTFSAWKIKHFIWESDMREMS